MAVGAARVSPRGLGVDLTPLRVSKQYRRLYIAGFITQLGGQATFITVPFQLRLLTHSPLLVGTLGLVELVPIVLFGLYGGVLADRLDRRRLILATEAASMATILVLFLNALTHHPQVWLIFLADAGSWRRAASRVRASERSTRASCPTSCSAPRRRWA